MDINIQKEKMNNEYITVLKELLDMTEKMWDQCYDANAGKYTISEFVSFCDLRLRILSELHKVS